MQEVRLTVKDIDDSNRRVKFTRAVESLSKAMKVPLTVKPKDKPRGEAFVYKSEEEIVKQWTLYMADTIDVVYRSVCAALELPTHAVFTKALGVPDEGERRPISEALLYRGHVVFNPETGKPIYREDFEKIIRAIERFMNKRLDSAARKIVLDSVALGRILARKIATMPSSEVRKLRLGEITENEKPFPWISESLKRQDQLYGPARPAELARMTGYYRSIAEAVDVAEDSMADYITRMTEDTKHAVRRSMIEGIKARQSKTEISQDLLNKFGGLNRDWGRIVETETVDTFNTAFILETVIQAEPGEKVLFKRIEMRDEFVCEFCENIRGVIALWVDHPLSSKDIEDPVAHLAIWQGKSNINRKAIDRWVPAGTCHPWCRGSWQRYFAPVSKLPKI